MKKKKKLDRKKPCTFLRATKGLSLSSLKSVWSETETDLCLKQNLLSWWKGDETKRKAAGTEECRRMDAMLKGVMQTEPLLHRGQKVRLQ